MKKLTSWKKYRIKGFRCPECGSDAGVLTKEKVIEYHKVTRLVKYDNDSVAVDTSDTDLGEHDRMVLHYMCWDCEYAIAETEEDLFNWLSTRGMLEEGH